MLPEHSILNIGFQHCIASHIYISMRYSEEKKKKKKKHFYGAKIRQYTLRRLASYTNMHMHPKARYASKIIAGENKQLQR